VRQVLATITALSLSVAWVANAQTSTGASSSAPVASDPTAVVELACVGQRGASIKLRRPGLKPIVLDLDGGDSCGGDGHYGSPGTFAIIGPSQAGVRTQNCAAFRVQSAKLKPSATSEAEVASVRAGPFEITDWARFFHLKNAEGRQAAGSWVRQTLAVVRPCWEISDDDLKPSIVSRLYGALGMQP
jgi:hypothetical protein